MRIVAFVRCCLKLKNGEFFKNPPLQHFISGLRGLLSVVLMGHPVAGAVGLHNIGPRQLAHQIGPH